MGNVFRDIKVDFSSSATGHILPVPCVCPHCGVVMAPKFIAYSKVVIVHKYYYTVVFQPNCCMQHFLVIFSYGEDTKRFTYLAHYPNTSPAVLPDSLKFSQRFVELHGQAHVAELNGHIELAGSGYRNALEVLIKDFAIEKLGKPRNEVIKKKLYRAIDDYLPVKNLKNSADVVRLLGNDNTHYEREYPGLGFEILKKYMQIFIDRIDAEILMLEPPIPLKRNHEPSEEV